LPGAQASGEGNNQITKFSKFLNWGQGKGREFDGINGINGMVRQKTGGILDRINKIYGIGKGGE
jgi:hypothetical protein